MLLVFAAAFAADPLPTPEAAPGVAPATIGHSGTALLPDARARAPLSFEATGAAWGGALEVTETCLQASPNGGGGCSGTSYEGLGAAGVRLAFTGPANLRVEANLGYTTDGAGIGTAALSWSGAVSDTVRLGVFVGGAGSSYSDFSGVNAGFGAGASVSARWDKVAFDATVPLVFFGEPDEETPIYLPWLFPDANVSFVLGRGHSVRVGLLSLAPGVGWQYTGSRLIARVDVHSLGLITAGKAEVGARF